MRLLLDTNAFLWLQSDRRRIGPHVQLLESADSDILVSAVVPWEIAIKFALGRMPLEEPPATYVPERMRRIGATAVPVTHEHALLVASLPPIHGDPFDRLLVAQAIALDATLFTGDAVLAEYPCSTLIT